MDNPYLIAITLYISACFPVIATAMFIDCRSEYPLFRWKDWAGISVMMLASLLIGATAQKYLLGA